MIPTLEQLKADLTDIKFDGIDHSDYPDYCDAYICDAKFNNENLTDEQMELINDDKEFVYKKLMDFLY